MLGLCLLEKSKVVENWWESHHSFVKEKNNYRESLFFWRRDEKEAEI